MGTMYKIMQSVIASRKVGFADVQERINRFYAEGALTVDEKAELEEQAFAQKDHKTEKAGWEEMCSALKERMAALEERVEALEGTEDTEDKIPAWEPWDGVSTNYQPGAKVKHNGRTWLNVLEGVQNTWEPGTVDERFWQEVDG